MTIKEIFELRKQGHVEQAYNAVLPMYKIHHGHYTTLCMFWCACDMAKLHIERREIVEAANILRSLAKLYPSIDDKDQSACHTLLNIALDLADEINNQLKLSALNPDLRDQVDKAKFSIIAFIDWWNINRLSDDDWKTIKGEKHPLPSLGVKICTRIFHEAQMSEDEKIWSSALNYIEHALSHGPNNRNMLRAKAYLLALLKRNDEAIAIYINLAQKAREAYVFSELADLVTDEKQKIFLSVKAISMQKADAFSQRDRLRLATLLATRFPQYARYELDYCIRIRQTNKQPMNKQIEVLQSQLANVQPATSDMQKQLYAKVLG